MPSTSWPVAALLRSADGGGDGVGAPSGSMVPGDGETSGPSEARSATGTGVEVAAGGELVQPARTRTPASMPGRTFPAERRLFTTPPTLMGREEGQGDDLGRDAGGADDVARHRPEAAPGQTGPRLRNERPQGQRPRAAQVRGQDRRGQRDSGHRRGDPGR